MTEAELLTVSQAAEALNASTQTIRNWIRSDRLTGVRIGNRFLIPRAEVERLRGDVGSPVGESPWAFEATDAEVALPRAAAAAGSTDPADGLLGS
jgi:excisionase family DNA binding protein